MNLTLTINSDNEGVQSFDDVATLLEDVASRVEVGIREAKIRDYNGNVVGSWTLTDGKS